MNIDSRNGNMLGASGFTMGADGTISGMGIDASGARRRVTVGAFGRGISAVDAEAIERASGVKIGAEGVDAGTADTLKYITSNNLLHNKNGAKAMAAKLAESGGLTAQSAQNIIENAVPIDTATMSPQEVIDKATERSYIADVVNGEASKAGLKHLSYNNIDTSTGAVKIGGAFGGTTGVVNRLMANGISTLTKEMLTDKTFSVEFGNRIEDMERTAPDAFAKELIKMTPRQIESLVSAQIDAGHIASTDKVAAFNSYLQKQADAAKIFKS
jgi:hypothetical protein